MHRAGRSARRLLRWVAAGLLALLWIATGNKDLWAQTKPGWRLVWADEFDGPPGSRPDPAWWTYDLGGGGWGNNELQTYTDRTNNCRIENGCLVIEAHRETYTGTDGIRRNYTSARLKTQGRLSWQYGRIEARIRLPRGQGLWPAFWMLGTNFPVVGWPACGEIDIMENIGREPDTVHGTIHGPGYSGANGISGRYVLPGGGALADDFHVYGVEWDPGRIRWFVDNTLFFSVTPASLPSGRSWVFDQPFFLILNVAVGGNWPGSPDETTVFPQAMLVDCVRVYQREDPARAGCGGDVLWNGGFEEGRLTGWVGTSGNVSVVGPSTGAHAGAYALRLTASAAGAFATEGAFQEFAVTPGRRFRIAGWVMNPIQGGLTSGQRTWLEAQFRDAAGGVLAVYRSAFLDAGATNGRWMRLEVTNRVDPLSGAVTAVEEEPEAPTGAVSLRIRVVLTQPAAGTGGVLWDNLECVPQPAPPVPVTAALRAGEMVLRFLACPGARYAILGSADLGSRAWRLEQFAFGHGAWSEVTLPRLDDRRFFTVQRR
jgi:beta-glucanase (GH16 family)